MICGKTTQEQLVIESIHRTINHMKTMNWKSLSYKMKEFLQLASEIGEVISSGRLNVISQYKITIFPRNLNQ